MKDEIYETTSKVLKFASNYVLQNKITSVLIASTSGKTALLWTRYKPHKKDLKSIIFTQPLIVNEDKKLMMSKRLRLFLISNGCTVVDVPYHYLRNKIGEEFVSLLRKYCDPMKVCFEIYLCALEEGIIKEGERILCIAGNVRGANTVMLFEYKSLFHICMGDLPNFKIIFSPNILKSSDLVSLRRNLKKLLKLKKKRKRVVAFGSFDIIHYGHIEYLRRAKMLGDKLFVILTSDKLYWKRKKKPPLHNEQERMKMISSLRFVDKVILSPSEDEPKEFAELISKIHPDIIALGYDLFPQRSEIDELYKRGCYPILVRIPAYKESKLKTSKIKKLLGI